ncbi:MAG: VWA domain-containing protein [Candidatus Competibacteraceae bacterium]|nr:VWA domain-containing protein [Candidatus Competibacteraceae bacterium]
MTLSMDFRKRIVDLSKKAAFAANKHGLEGRRAQVVLVLDISASMNALYKTGVIQRAIERILGLAVTFDDDGRIDLLLFGTNAYQLLVVTLEEIEGYVERVILAQYKIREATNYAPPLRLLLKKYSAPQPAPAFVIFITDGANADRGATAEVIRALSSEPVFLQFVGIGKEDFPFLRKLDELPGRLIDNAGFMSINDLDGIKDAELYDRLLNEFPRWLTKAREKRILAL